MVSTSSTPLFMLMGLIVVSLELCSSCVYYVSLEVCIDCG